MIQSTPRDLEIIVVDNASSDGTPELISSQYPKIVLVRQSTNIGFPAANNIGLATSTGEQILLLNPDTVVQGDCIERCWHALEGNPDVGMVGCKLIYPDGTLQFECACNFPSLIDPLIESFYLHMLLPHSRICGRLRMSYWAHDEVRRVPRISGAFMFMRRTMVTQVGFMNERYFMYYEDVDYCARVREWGWNTLYIPDAVTVHIGGESRKSSEKDFDDLAPLIRYTFFKEHAAAYAAPVYRVLCFIQAAARLCIALVLRVGLPRRAALRSRPVSKPRTHWVRLLWAIGIKPIIAKTVQLSPQGQGQKVGAAPHDRTKVLLVTNIPAPYRIPVFARIAGRLDFDFEVAFTDTRMAGRDWRWPAFLPFRWHVTNGPVLNVGSRRILIPLGLATYLVRRRPDVVVCGGFSLIAWLPVIWRAVSRKPYRVVLFGEATPWSERGVGGLEGWLRRRLVRLCDGFVAAGSDARDYFLALGANPGHVSVSILTTDIAKFHSVTKSREECAVDIRRKCALRSKVVMYCGKLSPEKGVELLLEAFAIVQRQEPDRSLLIVGTGSSEGALRARARGLGIESVHFVGHIEQDDLPAWYRAADVFAFPTLCDRFGVVVVEALLSGVPVVCSKYAGVARDLIRNGINGYIVDPLNVDVVAERLQAVLREGELPERTRLSAWECAKCCDVEEAAKVFGDTIQVASARASTEQNCRHPHALAALEREQQ